VPRLYDEGRLHYETAGRIVVDWIGVMAANLRGREPGSTGTSSWKMLPSKAVKTVTENTSFCAL
jgi:hypothetical protein